MPVVFYFSLPITDVLLFSLPKFRWRWTEDRAMEDPIRGILPLLSREVGALNREIFRPPLRPVFLLHRIAEDGKKVMAGDGQRRRSELRYNPHRSFLESVSHWMCVGSGSQRWGNEGRIDVWQTWQKLRILVAIIAIGRLLGKGSSARAISSVMCKLPGPPTQSPRLFVV